jgi:hypothetical protein
LETTSEFVADQKPDGDVLDAIRRKKESDFGGPVLGNHRPQYQETRLEVWATSQRLIPTGETIWIADAHRDDGQRFIVHADDKLTAFLELEAATRACGGFH